MNSESSSSSESLSAALYARARRVLPGGVSRNTVFRQPHPIYAASGSGCVVTDIEGRRFVDFSNNMASLIHGHAYPEIVEAVTEQLLRGSAFATATEVEVEYAEQLCDRSENFDLLRFVNSGTEAVMTALKAARAFTGKPKIAKAEGAYHGSYDYAEVSQTAKPSNWGEAGEPSSVPVAKGTPAGALNDVVVVPFNDIDATIERLDRHAKEIACVLLDPLPHRIGFVWATDEYVAAIHDWTRRHDALLVFDEVITFRCAVGGAQERYSQAPDLTALGKLIGGGFPIGAVAGRQDVMSVLDPTLPDLPFPHSGTFSANPISMTAGRIAMQRFDQTAVDELNRLGAISRSRLTQSIQRLGIPACVTGDGSFFRVHLKPLPPDCFRSCYSGPDESRLVRELVDGLVDHGMILINTCSAALSTVTSEVEIDQLITAFELSVAPIRDRLLSLHGDA